MHVITSLAPPGVAMPTVVPDGVFVCHATVSVLGRALSTPRRRRLRAILPRFFSKVVLDGLGTTLRTVTP